MRAQVVSLDVGLGWVLPRAAREPEQGEEVSEQVTAIKGSSGSFDLTPKAGQAWHRPDEGLHANAQLAKSEVLSV